MSTSITYTAVLDFSRETVLYLARLLEAERRARGTRRRTRRLGPFRQAVLVLRWLLDNTRIAQLATDNDISGRTCHRYVLEGISVLTAQAPTLQQAIERAKAAGHTHLLLDGTLIETDRCRVPGPTAGVDLWWSGKHKRHGGNLQVLSAPDGFPLWTSPVRPGAIRALAEKANADLKTRFKALRRVSLSPQRIGDIAAAALAIFHFEKNRTA